MAGIGVAHRTNTQSQLRVTSLGGTNAAFAAVVAAERDAAASSSPLVRARLKVLRRFRRMRWGRLSAMVLVGAFVAAFLVGLNIDSPREREVGRSAVAAAAEGDCIKNEDLGDWGWFNDVRDIAGDGINSVCRAFHAFGKFVSEQVLTPIGNFLWQAFHPNRFCGWRTRLDPDDSGSGLNALMMSANELLIGAGADDVGQTSTTWQQYGTAGTYWSTYFLDCFSSLHVSNAGANFVFTVSKVFSMAAILLFQQTFKSTIVDYFFEPQAGQSAPAIDGIIEKLQLDLYLQFFAVAVVIGATVVLYTAVVRGGGLVEGLSKFGMMAAVAGIALAYAGNGPQYIQKANEFTDELGATVMSALVGEECTNSDGSTVGERASGGGVTPTPPPSGNSPTTTPPNQQAAGRGAGVGMSRPLAAPGDEGKVNAYDCAAQSMYDILIFRPWANGEIGAVEVIGDEGTTKARKELAMRIMVQQSYSKSESNAIDAVPAADRRADVLRRYNEKRDARFKMVKDDWGARFIAADGQPEAKFAISGEDAWRPYTHVETDYPEYWRLFSGGVPGQRFLTAIMALIASVAMAMILATISVAYLVLQLMTIILAMVAPVVFLLALIPIFGTRLLMRWFEMLAGMYIKRLGLIIFIGMLLAGLQLVFKLPTPWWLQLLFVILIALAGISYRQQLSNWVTGGLEGMGKMAGGATGGLIGMKDAAGAAKKGAKTYAATKGMPAGTRAQASANAAYQGKNGEGAQTPESVRQAGQNQGQASGKKGNKGNQRSGTAQPHQPQPQRARNEPIGGRPQPGQYPPQDGSQVGVQRSSRNAPYMYEGR